MGRSWGLFQAIMGLAVRTAAAAAAAAVAGCQPVSSGMASCFRKAQSAGRKSRRRSLSSAAFGPVTCAAADIADGYRSPHLFSISLCHHSTSVTQAIRWIQQTGQVTVEHPSGPLKLLVLACKPTMTMHDFCKHNAAKNFQASLVR